MAEFQEQPLDLNILSELDFKFHDLLISTCDNQFLVSFARKNQAKFVHHFFFPFWEDTFGADNLFDRHLKIYEAIKTKDPMAVETAHRDHYMECARRTAKYAKLLY